MIRRCWSLVACLAALAFAPVAHAWIGTPGLNEARDQLASELKGAVVRCKTDILRATPSWSWDVMTTGTPAGVVYPNHTQPVAFEALSLVQLREFDVRNGGIRVVVTTPGFDLKRMGRLGWNLLDYNWMREADRHREVQATRIDNVQCAFLMAETAEGMRQALGALFFLDDEAPTQEDVDACLRRHADRPPSVARALCTLNGAEAVAFARTSSRPDVERIVGSTETRETTSPRPHVEWEPEGAEPIPPMSDSERQVWIAQSRERRRHERGTRVAPPEPKAAPPAPVLQPDSTVFGCTTGFYHARPDCVASSANCLAMRHDAAIAKGLRQCPACGRPMTTTP